MGYIEKRGASSWRICASVRTPLGQLLEDRYTVRMDPSLPESVQRQDAEQELRKAEKRLQQQAGTSWTVRSWSREWIDKLLKPDASPVTISNYEYLLNSRILPALGDYPLEDLTPALLTDWMIKLRSDARKTTRKPETQLARARRESEERALVPKSKLQKPLSAKTALNYYGCRSAMLAAAVRLGFIEHNPMDRVQRPKQKKNHKRRLTEEDAVRLIRALDDLPPEDRCYRLAVLLALLCGLRLGEVTALRYTDISWKKQTISIGRSRKYTSANGTFEADPKTDSAVRTIALPPSMIDLLTENWDQDAMDQIDYGIEDEKAGRPYRYKSTGMIIHNRFGQPLNKDTPSKWFRKWADAQGYPQITFHDLRHAHASILVAHNVDIAAIASRMGHSDATVTLSTYTHPFEIHDRLVADVLDKLLQPDPQKAPADPDPEDPADPDPADPAAAPG